METQGKIVVVTGGTSGIGQATAVDFATRGARVIVVGRDAARGAETKALAESAGATLEVVQGDVSTAEGVRRVAAAILARTSRIDVLLNNAGGSLKEMRLNAEGLEETFALNTLGAFRLERALHGALAAAGGRVVNVVTGFLDQFPVDVDDLPKPKAYKGMSQYGRAKLASVMMTVEQSRRFSGVTAVSVHPGIVLGTRFNGGQPKAMQAIAGPIMRAIGLGCTMEEAVRRFRVACFDDVPNGSYVVKGVPAPLPKQANDAAVRERVWALIDGAAA
jgi:NAD(P)-dependent dehydrogenase (short-subunit alcohol dehydrogenase family)